MELRDLIVTPIIVLLVYAGAFLIRPYATDAINRKYFLPALTVKVVGALAVGFIYQFYYRGGDTFTYHTFGSRIIWEAFARNPIDGIRILFSNGEPISGLYSYTSRIWLYKDQSSFFIIRIAALFDILTFSSYSATAILFAVVAFIGSWLMFSTFYKICTPVHGWIALSCLFIPSVTFWGSGIFKDAVTLSALGIATFFIYRIFMQARISVFNILMILLSFWIIYSIKKYILLTFLPAVIIWITARKMAAIKRVVLKWMLIPFITFFSGMLGYLAIQRVAEDDERYNLTKLAETAQVTAYDIRYWTGKDAGSGYALGELDGSFSNMLRLAPSAINVSLFRPYLWEVRNPLMLLSALEALAILLFTIVVIKKAGLKMFSALKNPNVLFCFIFALIFAFAVGVSTYNFGTLSRYKIPLMPFYSTGLVLVYYYSNRDKKFAEFDAIEK